MRQWEFEAKISGIVYAASVENAKSIIEHMIGGIASTVDFKGVWPITDDDDDDESEMP